MNAFRIHNGQCEFANSWPRRPGDDYTMYSRKMLKRKFIRNISPFFWENHIVFDQVSNLSFQVAFQREWFSNVFFYARTSTCLIQMVMKNWFLFTVLVGGCKFCQCPSIKMPYHKKHLIIKFKFFEFIFKRTISWPFVRTFVIHQISIGSTHNGTSTSQSI